jgi:multicomponent Na+:H+ antiporter subunit C
MEMVFETALAVGVLVGTGLFLMLQPSFVRILFGFILVSNAANLFLISLSGDPSGKQPPVMVDGAVHPVDPLPQALILTAIVIGFGVTAYLLVLLYRLFLDQRTTHAGEMFDPTHDPREKGGES